MRFILTGLSIIIAQAASSQAVSSLGRFSVDFPKGCSPVTIKVTKLDNFGNISRQYIYEPGMTETADTFHTYTSPGIYEIIQLNGENISPKTDTLLFEVVAPELPEFDLYQCAGMTLQVEVTDTYYDSYSVLFTATDSITYIPGNTLPSFTYPSDSGVVRVDGLFSNSYPGCGSESQPFNISNELVAPPIQNVFLTRVCQGRFAAVADVESMNLVQYLAEISFADSDYQPVYFGTISGGELVVDEIDNPQQDEDYCLRINVVDPCTGDTIPGVPFCGQIPDNQFSPLLDSYAGYEGRYVTVTAGSPTAQSILLERELNDHFQFVDSIAGSSYNTGSSHPYLYRLTLQDTCGNIFDSISIAPPHMEILERDYVNNELEFSLQEPVNNLSLTDRDVVIYNADSSVSRPYPFSTRLNLEADIGAIQKARVRYFYEQTAIPVYSNEVVTRYTYKVYVPTAFTPDGDGLNDQLTFFGLATDEAEISIFNRWGQRVFSGNDPYVGWDGQIGTGAAPEGSYTYKITFKSPDGEEFTQVGTFVLIKNR